MPNSNVIIQEIRHEDDVVGYIRVEDNGFGSVNVSFQPVPPKPPSAEEIFDAHDTNHWMR